MQERRRTPRLRSFLGGQIAFNRRASSMDCLIRNLSPDGAKLAFTNTLAVTDAFDLSITQRGETRRVRMIWRRQDEIGVEFVAPAAQASVVQLDAARRIRSLEAEKAALRQRIAQLSTAE